MSQYAFHGRILNTEKDETATLGNRTRRYRGVQESWQYQTNFIAPWHMQAESQHSTLELITQGPPRVRSMTYDPHQRRSRGGSQAASTDANQPSMHSPSSPSMTAQISEQH